MARHKEGILIFVMVAQIITVVLSSSLLAIYRSLLSQI
jgi:hypothetical protein